jgi:thiamine kinase-like enzyme
LQVRSANCEAFPQALASAIKIRLRCYVRNETQITKPAFTLEFMQHNHTHIDRLCSLNFWKSPISIETLEGGITNHNFLVNDAGRYYVARFCENRSLLGIDRRNEVICQRCAHGCGVAPEVLHHADGVLVSQHVPGKTLKSQDVRDPAFIPDLAAILHRLHHSWDRLTGEVLYFSAFQAVRTYATTAHRLDARLPSDIESLLEDSRRLSHAVQPFVPTLCHNDLLAGNIIVTEERVWLVDWEYAGMGNPLFDLAGISANCAFSESLEVALLKHYRGSVDERDLRDLQLLKIQSLLREALWAVIQTVASDIDFDYHRYAYDNFKAFREARQQYPI